MLLAGELLDPIEVDPAALVILVVVVASGDVGLLRGHDPCFFAFAEA